MRSESRVYLAYPSILRFTPFCPEICYTIVTSEIIRPQIILILEIICASYGLRQEAIEASKRLLEGAQKGEYPPIFAHLKLAAIYAALA